MSAQIISLAEFRARRQQATPLGAAEADAPAPTDLDRASFAAASRALAASIEAVRQQALMLQAARVGEIRAHTVAGPRLGSRRAKAVARTPDGVQ
ncbi:MAG: hypothetical protein ACLQJR_14015 [Stellaceae bacterium]